MQKFKKKKLWKGIIIGIGLTVLTLFVLVTVFVRLFFTGGAAKKTKDVERYSEIFDFRLNTGLLIFPESLKKETTETDFYYYYRDTFGSPTYEIYLQCKYEPQDYEAEIKRLENTRKIYGGTEKKLLRDEDKKYNYPAYIAIENHHHSYEYALVTGENEITYISTAFRYKKDIAFEADYLPKDYMTEQDRSFTGGYSIYISSMDSVGIVYDTTRNEKVTVADAHMEQIEDSYFIVRTELDEQNREIITECSFDYYEDLDDDEVESTVYSELNGMEYRELTLNEDRTKAIVKYYDGSEEKEFVVDIK